MLINIVLLWGFFLISWLSLFLMKKENVRRYMPVALLGSLIVTIVYENAYLFEWWELFDGISPWSRVTDTAFAQGTFLVGTIWIFHLTYGRFWLYILANLATDAFFAFGVMRLGEYLGHIELQRIGHFGIFLMMVGTAFLLYPFQVWLEGKAGQENDGGPSKSERVDRPWFEQKAR